MSLKSDSGCLRQGVLTQDLGLLRLESESLRPGSESCRPGSGSQGLESGSDLRGKNLGLWDQNVDLRVLLNAGPVRWKIMMNSQLILLSIVFQFKSLFSI